MVGCILAVFTAKLFSRILVEGVGPEGEKIVTSLHPKWVFLVGIAPALLTLWIRSAVPESESWAHAKSTQATPSVLTLFRGGVARITWITTALTSIALTTVWSFLYFGPQLLRSLPEIAEKDKTSFASDISVIYLTVNIIANFAATYLARWLGHKKAFFLMMLGALIVNVICFGHRYLPWAPAITRDNAAIIFSLTAFFGLGLFGMFPLYIPALFPTLVRTLGAGFTYNIGRLVSAFGALLGGVIVNKVGGYDGAIWWTGLLYVPGLVVAMMAPEVKEESEPSM